MNKLHTIFIALSLMASSVTFTKRPITQTTQIKKVTDTQDKQDIDTTKKAITNNQQTQNSFTPEQIALIEEYLKEQKDAGQDISPKKFFEALLQAPKENRDNFIAALEEQYAQKNAPMYQKAFSYSKEFSKKIISKVPGMFVQGLLGVVIGGITQYYGKQFLTWSGYTNNDEEVSKAYSKGMLAGALALGNALEKKNPA